MKTAIVGPGTIGKELFNECLAADQIIVCDRGARHFRGRFDLPDLYIGDFDSVRKEDYERIPREKRVDYPPEKDYTDFELALSFAEGDEILAAGFLGGRLDHELANILLTKKMYEKGKKLVLVDEQNRISWLGSDRRIRKTCKYLSFIPLTESVISMKGFKYPLDEKTTEISDTLTISNEITDKEGFIRLHKGYGILIESTD